MTDTQQQKALTHTEIVKACRSMDPQERAEGYKALHPDRVFLTVLNKKGTGETSLVAPDGVDLRLIWFLAVWACQQIAESMGMELNWVPKQADSDLVVAKAVPGPYGTAKPMS
jgi:hypothetical protein